jgi:hypothetical protein
MTMMMTTKIIVNLYWGLNALHVLTHLTLNSRKWMHRDFIYNAFSHVFPVCTSAPCCVEKASYGDKTRTHEILI